MPAQYRLLTPEELAPLEREFVEFLILNGVMADDWEAMKRQEPDDARRMLELFSDVVFEGILRKAQFIEWRSARELRAFQCLPDRLVMMALKAPEQSDADFSDEAFVARAMQSPPAGLQAYTAEKPYAGKREMELFGMLQQGCLLSDGRTFKAIALLLASRQ